MAVCLNLSHNGLKILPTYISTEIQLKILLLNNNSLVMPPTELKTLQNLTHLSLEYNSLTILPSDFGTSLHLLVFLNLSHNCLVSLPQSFAKLLNLKELWLNGLNLNEFPSEICSLIQLEVLSLAENNLSECLNEIKNLVNLKWISFAHNKLSCLPQLILSSQLKVLYLQYNSMTVFPIELLLKMKHLSILDLSYNQFQNVPGLQLISSCQNISKLDLRGNPLLKEEEEIEGDRLPWRKLNFVWY